VAITARKDSGADRNNGKDRMRSKWSRGIPEICEAVRGDGRIGREGFVSESNVLISANGSGIGVPLALLTAAPPAEFR
jgi:hypothetical protein